MNLIVNVSLGGEVVELEQLTPKEYELVRRECVKQFLELARKKRKTKEDISHLEHWSVFLHRTFSEVFDIGIEDIDSYREVKIGK